MRGPLFTQRQSLLRMIADTVMLLGSSTTRAGWSFDSTPRLIFPPVMSRYRERKLARTYTLVGHDASVDAAARGQIRTAFEAGSGIVSNWDVMENVLDYIFLKLGVDGTEGGIGRPVVMTEPMANLGYPRKGIYLDYLYTLLK